MSTHRHIRATIGPHQGHIRALADSVSGICSWSVRHLGALVSTSWPFGCAMGGRQWPSSASSAWTWDPHGGNPAPPANQIGQENLRHNIAGCRPAANYGDAEDSCVGEQLTIAVPPRETGLCRSAQRGGHSRLTEGVYAGCVRAYAICEQHPGPHSVPPQLHFRNANRHLETSLQGLLNLCKPCVCDYYPAMHAASALAKP